MLEQSAAPLSPAEAQRATKYRAISSPRSSSPPAREPRNRNVADEWLNATLLGAAFDAGDCDKAEDLAAEVAAQGAASWKIDSTLGDLNLSVSQVEDKDTKDRLQAILATLKPAVG